MSIGHTILSLRGLTVDFTIDGQIYHAVRGVDLDVHHGEVVAIVGESGSGKSTVALAVMGLLAANARVAGHAIFDDMDLVNAPKSTWGAVRGKRISMIFQDPMTSLNPVLTIGRQLSETILAHQDVDKKQALEKSQDLLDLVAIPHASERLRNYPHELSGGMRQRVMIAIAMANDPEILIADEPTTALDVTIQAQILDVLTRLQRDRGLAVVLVTHDLGVVANLADSVHVMYSGSMVEEGTRRGMFYQAQHPYTRGLLACSPRLDRTTAPSPIAGNPPRLTEVFEGCAFAPRCDQVEDVCRVDRPELRTVGSTRVACLRAPLAEVPKEVTQ